MAQDQLDKCPKCKAPIVDHREKEDIQEMIGQRKTTWFCNGKAPKAPLIVVSKEIREMVFQ